MSINNEQEKVEISNNKESTEKEKDIISKILKNEQEFITLINKLLKSEFEEIFQKILNLPKIDFLNELTSNVSFILSDLYSSEIFENDKCMSLIASTCRSFDSIYNKYIEEVSEGWDHYYENINNQIQKSINENTNIFFLTKFRKHCNKTQNYAIHQCNNNGETGKFIIVYGHSSSQKNDSKENNNNINKKMKYLICDNCRKSFFIHEFDNFCEFCKVSYLCGPLIKEENENLFPATLDPPHCESFVNEELLCDKCNNKLFIDLKNNNLICGNKECDYCISIEANEKINFKCKICKNNFFSKVKIYNPLELVYFRDTVNKALLYKRKAYPGKLSCCKKIKEKKSDFFHKKDCKGNLYFAEYNQKIILICSKCRAVNQYNKFIWTCPECGLHFRDKRSEENEIKIKKTKSSNKLYKAKKVFPNLEEENYLTLNGNKRSFAEILNKRRLKSEKNTLYSNYNKYEESKTERKRISKSNYLSQDKSNEINNTIGKNIKENEIRRKKKGMYIFGKILPWGTPKKIASFKAKKNNANKTEENNEQKREYYDKKVNDLINANPTSTENGKNEKKQKEDEKRSKYLCKSGRIHFKYNEDDIDSNSKEDIENKNSKEKKLYLRNSGIDYFRGNYDSLKKIELTQSTKDISYAFNKKNSPEVQNMNFDNDFKCSKFIPIKIKYSNKQNEDEQNNNNEKNKDDGKSNNNNDKGILNLLSRIKKQTPLDLKQDILNQRKNFENKSNNNKESWQSKETKETTTKGSIESKNSIFSHSPIKEEEDKKLYKNNLFLYNNNILINKDNSENKEIDNNNNNKNNLEEDDIIPFEMLDLDKEIIIENIVSAENKKMYEHIERKLKKILLKGSLPYFDLDKFTIDKQIGDGSFGVIYLVHNNKSKKKYAMKKILATNINSLESFQKEFEIVHNNPHPSILDIKGICLKCFDSTTFSLYVLMDLAERDWEEEINERQKYKKFYKEKELISILKQLCSALYFLQKEKNVAHRDIKPENVLIFKKIVDNKIRYGEYLYKLCDFGEAKDFSLAHSKKNKTLRGTELYMSPALYNGLMNESPYVNHDAFKSDVFSLGCCMIIASNLDFEIINEIRELKDQQKITELLNEKLIGKYSEKFIDIVLKMINFNEKERIDFIQLKEIIESTF